MAPVGWIFNPSVSKMALHEQDREDLLSEATALVQRVELRVEGFAEPVIVGFRRGGEASVFFGADPVEMPMGEVYSALAKGVLDGVVAPKDTLKSLHFAEVAHYFNTLNIPRGAYAARAMGERRWRTLDDAQRAILEEGVEVWQQALESELHAAELAGDALGREHGVVYTAPPRDDVRKFLEGYDHFAERSAQRLERFGIDGMTAYRIARECHGDAT